MIIRASQFLVIGLIPTLILCMEQEESQKISIRETGKKKTLFKSESKEQKDTFPIEEISLSKKKKKVGKQKINRKGSAEIYEKAQSIKLKDISSRKQSDDGIYQSSRIDETIRIACDQNTTIGTVFSKSEKVDRRTINSIYCFGKAPLKALPNLQDFSKLTILSVNTESIDDITFLENSHTLTYLDLSNNKITNLSPMTKLSALSILLCSKNNIQDISPLVKLSSLTHLSVAYNNIQGAEKFIRLISQLQFLDIEENPLLGSDLSLLYNAANQAKAYKIQEHILLLMSRYLHDEEAQLLKRLKSNHYAQLDLQNKMKLLSEIVAKENEKNCISNNSFNSK